MTHNIRTFHDIRLTDIAIVGGKNASLGELTAMLSPLGIAVPDGFAVTAHAFVDFLQQNNLQQPLSEMMQQISRPDYSNLAIIGAKARQLILDADLSPSLSQEIVQAYVSLGEKSLVAVRSSATAEDLPQASFAGQHESFLNVKGRDQLLHAVKKCFASLYTDRAIKYREDNGFRHDKVMLSVGIQLMVRSEKACSGVAFTLEPESGFRDIIHISGVWGLGENIVQGTVTPDEFLIFKPTLKQKHYAILQKKLGEKSKTMVYMEDESSMTVNLDTSPEKQRQFVLSDEDITRLAEWCMLIENHYKKPMDIEWAQDGNTGNIFILQARPETVHAQKNPLMLTAFHLVNRGEKIVQGEAIGNKAVTGIARLLTSPAEASRLGKGEIVVTDLTSPDWDPLLKKAGAIITNKGGRTSHASIVARELGVPAIVGCTNATYAIRDGDPVTVSCCEGKTGNVYRGHCEIIETRHDLSDIHLPHDTKVMLITADPEKAFSLSFYPNNGVGLMRIEFIITHAIGIHPMALVKFDEVKDVDTQQKIEQRTAHCASKTDYFIDKLAEGVATMAAAFYPKEVIVRMSDFKTNEYANLLGGRYFEPKEENPMIGFRGASRYYHDLYREGFRLECKAISKVRDSMGFTNVKVMIPFCRTVEEGELVIAEMKRNGLEQGVNNLEVYVMAEIPSNVILGEKFANIFDGFSIGSNDLTQLTLGIDRDSNILSASFSEQQEAAKAMIAMMIAKAKKAGVNIGLCGQAPSDFPEFAQFLVMQGIDSISFNEDALLKGIENIRLAESQRNKTLQPIGSSIKLQVQ
jgi:pyruvate,water dikinase